MTQAVVGNHDRGGLAEATDSPDITSKTNLRRAGL